MRALQPILLSEDPASAGLWVDARPFRAHLGQLLSVGLTEPVVARLTGLSVRAVEHLAHGRSGRPVRRICSESARRLLRITTAEARALRFRPVPVRASRARLRAMAAYGMPSSSAPGWTEQRLADAIGISIRDAQQVLGRGSATCSQLTALKIAAAYERWTVEHNLAAAAA